MISVKIIAKSMNFSLNSMSHQNKTRYFVSILHDSYRDVHKVKENKIIPNKWKLSVLKIHSRLPRIVASNSKLHQTILLIFGSLDQGFCSHAKVFFIHANDLSTRSLSLRIRRLLVSWVFVSTLTPDPVPESLLSGGDLKRVLKVIVGHLRLSSSKC